MVLPLPTFYKALLSTFSSMPLGCSSQQSSLIQTAKEGRKGVQQPAGHGCFRLARRDVSDSPSDDEAGNP